MISTGFSSKALKKLNTTKIIELCAYCHIHKIEWDSYHVPPTDLKFVAEIERHCRLNYLLTVSYNTNLVVTENEDITDLFEQACLCAKTLRSPAVNITVGTKPVDQMSNDEYMNLVKKTNELCKASKNLMINLLPDKNSVASNYSSALNFLADVHMTNLKIYWTADPNLSDKENIKALEEAVRFTTNVYISSKTKDGKTLPILEAKERWRSYGKIIREDLSRLHLFILDSIPFDNPELLSREFASVRHILAKIRK